MWFDWAAGARSCSDTAVLERRSVGLKNNTIEKEMLDSFGTVVATTEVTFTHSNALEKERRRGCPDKIWISWCGVLVTWRIFVLSMVSKKGLVIDDALFTTAHSSLHCCHRRWRNVPFVLDQAILVLFVVVIGFSTAARASLSMISFPHDSLMTWQPVETFGFERLAEWSCYGIPRPEAPIVSLRRPRRLSQ